MSIRSEFIDITPEMAQSMMDASGGFPNRNVRFRQVDKLVRDIASGQWQLNGESIKINPKGEVIDGQHRVLAIIKSGVTVPSLVVYDVPTCAVETVDRGAKRQFADTLRMRGRVQCNKTAAAASTIWRVSTGRPGSNKDAPSDAELMDIIDRFTWIEKLTNRVDKKFGRLCGGGGGTLAMFAIFHEINPRQADEFMTKMLTGLGLTPDDPVYRLRQAFEGETVHSTSRRQSWYLAMMIKCWNAIRGGRSPKVLRWSPSQEGFPSIHGQPW